ncbi:MAG: HmuY family protein, partial [Sediminibacterium sp.]|nr:HmuY family protein [Sediminibacterium sp.]
MKKIIYALSAFLFFTACDKDDNTTKVDPVISVTVTNLPADTIIGITPGAPPSGGMPYGAGKYTFFSLERGVVVPATDSASNKWDIAFKGSTILTNSGNG